MCLTDPALQRANLTARYHLAVAKEAIQDHRALEIQRDRAHAWNQVLGGACTALMLAVLYVLTQEPAPALECPASGVMQLDPTTVRARASEAVEI